MKLNRSSKHRGLGYLNYLPTNVSQSDMQLPLHNQHKPLGFNRPPESSV